MYFFLYHKYYFWEYLFEFCVCCIIIYFMVYTYIYILFLIILWIIKIFLFYFSFLFYINPFPWAWPRLISDLRNLERIGLVWSVETDGGFKVDFRFSRDLYNPTLSITKKKTWFFLKDYKIYKITRVDLCGTSIKTYIK